MQRLRWEYKKRRKKIIVSKKVKIINPSGLHLRTATVLSNSVLKYNARLQFAYEKNNVKGVVNLKSILNIVAAGVVQGQEIVITSEGPDEEEALAAAVAAIENGL